MISLGMVLTDMDVDELPETFTSMQWYVGKATVEAVLSILGPPAEVALHRDSPELAAAAAEATVFER